MNYYLAQVLLIQFQAQHQAVNASAIYNIEYPKVDGEICNIYKLDKLPYQNKLYLLKDLQTFKE